MTSKNYPSLQSFIAKAGIGDCFAQGRYSDDLPKPVALARVAIWAAVADEFKVGAALTAGQITTVVDAAPLIVGRPGLEKLEGVTSIQEMGDFVKERHQEWWAGISAAAQWWSLRMAVGDRTLIASMRDSKITDVEAGALALTAYHQKVGHIYPGVQDDRNALYSVPELAARIQVGAELMAKKESEQSIRILNSVKNGEWTLLANSREVQDFEREANLSAPDFEEPKSNVGMYAFVGPSTPKEHTQLSVMGAYRKVDEDFTEFLARTPLGSFVKIHADKWLAGQPNSDRDDYYNSGLIGYHRSLEEYSPIFTPAISTTDVRVFAQRISALEAKSRGGDPEGQALFSELIGEPVRVNVADEAKTLFGELEPFKASRFAAFASGTWMAKSLREARQSSAVYSNPESLKLKARIEAAAYDLMAGGMSESDAIKFASSEIRAEECTDREGVEDAMYAVSVIDGIEEHLSTRRSNRVNLDAKIGDGDADMHQFFPDDMRQDLTEFSAEEAPDYPDREPSTKPDFVLGNLNVNEEWEHLPLEDRIQRFMDESRRLGAKSVTSALSMLASTRLPVDEEMENAMSEISEKFKGDPNLKSYQRILIIATRVTERGYEVGAFNGSEPSLLIGEGKLIAENMAKVEEKIRTGGSGRGG